MVERCFSRQVEALGSIVEFVRGFFAANGISADHEFETDLILEELFTNIVRHTPGGGHDVSIGLGFAGGELTIALRDFEVEPFDITAVPSPDLTVPLHQRTPGGLGVYLVRTLADTVRYEYADRTSTVTVTKRLEF